MTIIDFHTHFFPEKLYQAIWEWFDKYSWNIQHRVLADYFPKQPSLTRIEKLSNRILYGSDSPLIPYPLDSEMRNIKLPNKL